MTEVYRDIQGYEGLYQISNLGNVKSLNYNHTGKEKVLSCCVDKDGYLGVVLCKNCKPKHFRVHRLVAQAFIPNPENKQYVDHVNTVRSDNSVSNLQWVTIKENQNNELTKQKMSSSHKGKFKGKHWKLENGKRIYY